VRRRNFLGIGAMVEDHGADGPTGRSSPPPGWFPDPRGGRGTRWWDGEDWTDHVQDEPASPPVTPEPASTAVTPAWAHSAPVPAPAPAAGGHGAVTAAELATAKTAHLLTLIGYVIPLFIHIIIPTVILLTKGKESAYVAHHAKESLNFNISITIYYVIAGLALFVLIGWLMIPAIFVFDVVNVFRMGGRAGRGQPAHYPLTLRLVS
jgi:uncharacterized protein